MPDYTALSFPPPPPLRPYVLLNMIVSLDGRSAIEGSEAELGSPTDRRLMRELRAHADVVLVGGETFRTVPVAPRAASAPAGAAGGSGGKASLPIAAVLSRSGDLPLDRPFFTDPNFDSIVYLSEECPRAKRDTVNAGGRRVVMVPSKGTIPAMLRHMRAELKAERLLLECGPSLNSEFFAEDAIDEWFLTLAPLVAGGSAAPAVASGSTAWRRPMALVSWGADDPAGHVYLRYRRRRDG